MGRTVLAEEAVKNVTTDSQSTQELHIGLLVGQLTERQDLVALAVRTPSLQDFNAAEDGEQQNNQSKFIDWWVVEHAQQVTGMLPGGLNVVGVYICCQSLSPLLARLAKILTDIAAGQEFKGHQPHQHLSLLHYCLVKKKFKCQSIDSSDPQAGFKPAELKFKAHMSQWSKIEAVVSMDTECFIPGSDALSGGHEQQGNGKGEAGKGEREGQRVKQGEAKAAVSGVLESLQGAVVTLHGRVRDGSSLAKSSKKLPQGATQAALYLRRIQQAPGPPVTLARARRVVLKGCMSLVAYVEPKATCAEAVAAVKQDACRSLVSRIQAMVEYSAQSEAALDQLPMRVALSATPWHFIFTEYSLPHEETQECIGRASDLLGADSASIAAHHLEQFPQEEAGEEGILERDKEYKHVLTQYYGFASIFATISVVLVSISVWIMLQ